MYYYEIVDGVKVLRVMELDNVDKLDAVNHQAWLKTLIKKANSEAASAVLCLVQFILGLKMKFIIDKEVLSDLVAKSMMSKIAYELVQEYDLCVILNRYDGGYHVTIHEFIDLIDELNLEDVYAMSDEFEDGYPVEYAISDVLHDLMSKIWE